MQRRRGPVVPTFSFGCAYATIRGTIPGGAAVTLNFPGPIASVEFVGDGDGVAVDDSVRSES